MVDMIITISTAIIITLMFKKYLFEKEHKYANILAQSANASGVFANIVAFVKQKEIH